MAKTPKHIAEIARALYADEDGPQWDALAVWRISPNADDTVAMFEAILLRGAYLHQESRKAVAK